MYNDVFIISLVITLIGGVVSVLFVILLIKAIQHTKPNYILPVMVFEIVEFSYILLLFIALCIRVGGIQQADDVITHKNSWDRFNPSFTDQDDTITNMSIIREYLLIAIGVCIAYTLGKILYMYVHIRCYCFINDKALYLRYNVCPNLIVIVICIVIDVMFYCLFHFFKKKICSFCSRGQLYIFLAFFNSTNIIY